ncbi:molybdopterin cofactor-binding domain-containing protein [Paucibacter sp. R3-3]|uniref:Molybdopterin cofactor-binding domain-containing protein n=1 Tax=Roseateles agri TaxID=3098619 RepID=A0ABU5DKS1_9BURK|nr:molybdopterin cofactor-binding domain-containing protein [Paucibacter sp. R3-3]MDY0746882.1 molybdopterin cofactor-binding domain-containing protein [Paucibacter sp. R3-3]
MGNDDGWIEVNGQRHDAPADLSARAIEFLREDLGLTGTKLGCGQGDCGSCTILVDGAPHYACILPTAQLTGRRVLTIEGLATGSPCGSRLQDAFLAHQAVQCGFCIPGMLMASAAAIDAGRVVDRPSACEAIEGVLCRCTGYRKIVDAVTEVGTGAAPRRACLPAAGKPEVGRPITRLDGRCKVDGSQHFGADGFPPDSLYLRAVRCPHPRARFTFGDLDRYVQEHPGLRRVFTHADVPGDNVHGVATPYADQPALAVQEARHHLEAVALIAGERDVLMALDMADFPVTWEALPAVFEIDDATAPGSPLLHEARPGNLLIEGRVVRGDTASAIANAAHVVSGSFQSSFVEHAYIEPEAGWARRVGDTVEVHSTTQSPHPHRADLARMLALPKEQVRVVPTAVGGGFGGKLDMTVQPLLAIAAWHLDRPVAMVLTREESMATSTKRHPARMVSTMAADAAGRICAVVFEGDYNTGAYASWGTAVANRVPVHAGGPYRVPHYAAHARAVHTHITPAGAFRGFGVPQTMMLQEQLIDALARQAGIDALEFRLLNALKLGDSIPTGQVLHDSVGMFDCLEALRPAWQAANARAQQRNGTAPGLVRHGVGLAAFFYGIGNTALTNPSTVRIGLRPDGGLVLHQGAVDAGQGSNTVIPQIAADALGVPLARLQIIGPDTHLTPDCGRTSASRQTFVTGRAAFQAGQALLGRIRRLAEVDADAPVVFGEGGVTAGGVRLDLAALSVDPRGYVIAAEESFDPPTTSLDAAGQGVPYAAYAFGAQVAEVEVDCETGRVRVRRVVAAHDVGRMVNPTLLEGQIEGAVAQGVGMALMEKYHPGLHNNLHDYLIPTVHDMPEVETIFIESPTALGPYGAKGIGEPALVPTAAAILNAVHDAIGARLWEAPADPQAVLRALAARGTPA